jgi:tetratricopeptide (TPR) repeat protein
MKCSKAKKWTSQDIDNGLDTAQKGALEAHLDGCWECRKLRENFKTIAATAKGLEEYSPRGETWFKIASRIKDKQPGTVQPVRMKPKRLLWKPGVLVWTASAALLLAVVAGMIYFGPKIWNQDPGSQKYVLSKLGEAERHYQKAIDALWQAVSSQKEDLDPQLYAVFQKNLDIIDQSIIACKDAVLSRPDSLDSRNFLLAAYKEKRNLLEEMMTATTSPVEQRDVGSIY